MSPSAVKVTARPRTKKSEKTSDRLTRRRLPVPGDDAHQERDHGQNAGIQGRRHAAQEDGDDRQPRAVLEERGNVAEEAFHLSSAHWTPCFFRSSRISSLGKSPTWRAISFPFWSTKTWVGMSWMPYFSARLGVLPDVVEDDLDPVGEGRGDLLHDRLHLLAGDAAVGAELDERDLRYLEKSMSSRFVTRTLP